MLFKDQLDQQMNLFEQMFHIIHILFTSQHNFILALYAFVSFLLSVEM